MGDDIKTDLGETGYEGGDWDHLSQDEVPLRFCEHDDKPLGSIKAGNFMINLVTQHFKKTLHCRVSKLLLINCQDTLKSKYCC
jgi:hypothetical protein